MEETILLVDDEENTRTALSIALKREGYNVLSASNGEDGMEILDKSPVDIVLTDLKMPGVTGIELLKYASGRYPDVMVIVITGYASVESAITAMKDGAFDYITKPIKLEEVKITLKQACEKRNLLIENLLLKQQLKGKYRFENMVGASRPMQEVFSLMEKVAGADSTVLITGESGTGKELVAKAIHYNGPRKDKPFVAVNCAAIPGELLESELFGHLKGSFTGAVANRTGRFELAHTGTIFLDEIGSMTLPLQGKILRVLQEKEIERVGGGKTMKVDVRVISATNVNLERAVKRGHFRDDLYYRLNVIPIHLPPLRERVEDIPILAGHFIRKYSERLSKDILGLGPGVMDYLPAYDWPGNIRELENVLSSASIFAPGRTIAPDAFENVQELAPLLGAPPDDEDEAESPDDAAGAAPRPAPAGSGEALDYFGLARSRGLSLKDLREEMESQCISRALAEAKGNISEAARLLQMKRSRLSQIVNADPALRAQAKGG